jgi:hypothetical protein
MMNVRAGNRFIDLSVRRHPPVSRCGNDGLGTVPALIPAEGRSTLGEQRLKPTLFAHAGSQREKKMSNINIELCPETGICSIIKGNGSKIDLMPDEVSRVRLAAGNPAAI